MHILNNHEFQQLSFPDAQILEMQLLAEEQTLVVQLDSAWLAHESLEQTNIVLKNWDVLHIRLFEYKQQKWQDLSLSSIDYLKDICEAELSKSEVVFRGFGHKTGQWIEYKIQGKQLAIVCYTTEQLALAA